MITVHVNAIGVRDFSRDLVRRAVSEALRHERIPSAEMSVTFMSDAEITELQTRYLGRSSVTDVLSFALHVKGQDPLGDIYIGHGQALRQAAAAGAPPEEELARLAVHGTLHVLGYDHPEGPERAGCEMFRVQEEVLRKAVGP